MRAWQTDTPNNTDNTDRAEYQRFKAFKESSSTSPKFSWSAAPGKVMGFSGIAGVTNAKISLGKTKKQVVTETVKPAKPRQLEGVKDEPVKPPKPRKNDDGKDATIKDIEEAVRKGFITPDEATGGGVEEKWYESMVDEDGNTSRGKQVKVKPMSKNYATKMGKAQAESQATGKPLGKQFTGPTSMKIETGRKAGFGEKAPSVDLSGF